MTQNDCSPAGKMCRLFGNTLAQPTPCNGVTEDEHLIGHRDLLKVYPAQPCAFRGVEHGGRIQGGRGQHHVSGERQLSVETIELFTESHGAAERDDGVHRGQGVSGNFTPVFAWHR